MYFDLRLALVGESREDKHSAAMTAGNAQAFVEVQQIHVGHAMAAKRSRKLIRDGSVLLNIGRNGSSHEKLDGK